MAIKPSEIADAALTASLAGFVILIGYMTWRTWRTAYEDENWRQFIHSHSELGDLGG